MKKLEHFVRRWKVLAKEEKREKERKDDVDKFFGDIFVCGLLLSPEEQSFACFY